MTNNYFMAKKRLGFSLVELLAVVAIIGILAIIGIPQYKKFAAKARQAEAKTHLNALYQSQIAFSVEHGIYTTSMISLAYTPVGTNLRYNAGFDTIVCPGVSASAPVPGTTSDNDIISNSSLEGAPATWFFPAISDPGGLTSCDSLTNTFSIGAWGNPTSDWMGGNNADQFVINQDKRLSNVSVGL